MNKYPVCTKNICSENLVAALVNSFQVLYNTGKGSLD